MQVLSSIDPYSDIGDSVHDKSKATGERWRREIGAALWTIQYSEYTSMPRRSKQDTQDLYPVINPMADDKESIKLKNRV